MINKTVRHPINFTGAQRSIFLAERTYNPICDLLILCIYKVHSVVITVLSVRDDVFLHQKAFSFIKHLLLGNLFVHLASNESF